MKRAEFDARHRARFRAISSEEGALLLAKPLARRRSEAAGGWGGIRTLETLARLPVFKTGAFNHSATHPIGDLRVSVVPRKYGDGVNRRRLRPRRGLGVAKRQSWH
jgi:hypothetical protein